MNKVHENCLKASPAVHNYHEPLRVLGTSVTQVAAVKKAAEQDLGNKINFITLDGAAAQCRGALEPQSFDVYDQWFHDLDLIWPTGSLQPLDVNRLLYWDDINELPKTGRLSPEKVLKASGDPSHQLYVQMDGGLSNEPTERVSMVPTVHNADSFAILGDIIADSWSALLAPENSGRVILQSDPAIGALDMLLALKGSNEMHPTDLANLMLTEIDTLVDHLSRYRNRGQFQCFWNDESEAVDAMLHGLPLIGSLWWSGLIRLKAKGLPVRMATPKEGYRGWYGGLAIANHLRGRALDESYEYLNWWLGGGPGALLARSGAYIANHSAAREKLTKNEWAFWYEGKPAEFPIYNIEGCEVYARGELREGGSYRDRMGKVVVWNTVMTEHNYLMRRWTHAIS